MLVLSYLLAEFAAAQGVLTRVSLSSSGVQGNGDSFSDGSATAFSADGRYVTFWSGATNLVAGDTNGFTDVFVRDRLNGLTTRVSIGSGGVQANDASESGSISADGRYVAFFSWASNLVPGDTNGKLDVFVRDVQSGQTSRASVDSNGVQGNDASLACSLSADGRHIAFQSAATNLVVGDTNGMKDVFVRDLQTGQTVRASVGSAGVQANGLSRAPSISSDGRYVAFESAATNLVLGDTNATNDVFVRDLQSSTTVRVSTDSAGVQANGTSSYPQISADGRYIAFLSDATNLIASDTNGFADVFVHDRQTGSTVCASVSSVGVQANDITKFYFSISADGRCVAFASAATNLVPGDTNQHVDTFVRDLQLGQTSRASVSSAGVEGDADSAGPSISSDGRYVAFWGAATNLVSGDTNAKSDAFVHDRFCDVPTIYCTAKTNSLGCAPSISMSSAPSASAASGCTLTTVNVIGNKNGLYFHGKNGASGAPFHGGYLCCKAPLTRHALLNSGGAGAQCNGILSEDFDAYIASGADPALVAGATVELQCWSRDPNAPFTDSLSDAVSTTICP